jgi:hypothetical protein
MLVKKLKHHFISLLLHQFSCPALLSTLFSTVYLTSPSRDPSISSPPPGSIFLFYGDLYQPNPPHLLSSSTWREILHRVRAHQLFPFRSLCPALFSPAGRISVCSAGASHSVLLLLVPLFCPAGRIPREPCWC